MAVAGMIGKKIGMTQVFDENGEIHPITVVQVGPCVITQMKTQAKDGYDAAQIGLVEFVKSSKINKAMAGHFGKSNVPPVRILREVPIEVEPRQQKAKRLSAARPAIACWSIFLPMRSSSMCWERARVAGLRALFAGTDLAADRNRTDTCSRCRDRSALRLFLRA